MNLKFLAPLLLVITSCSSGPSGEANSAPSGDILIASDLTILGVEGGDARQASQAIQLAISEHPTIGGHRLAYWLLDNALAGDQSLEKGVQNVRRMAAEPRVLGMVGPWTSPQASLEIPEGNRADLVMVSPSNTRGCLTVPDPKKCSVQPADLRPSGVNNYFRLAAPDPIQGRAMGRYAAEVLKLMRVAAINEWGNDGDQAIQLFAAEFSRHGGTLVMSQDLPTGTTNFSGAIAEAVAKHAQAIYAQGGMFEGICVARAQMPPDMLFLGSDGFSNVPDCLKQAGPSPNGIIATWGDVDASKSTDQRAVAETAKFRKMFPGTEGFADYVFAAYDCTLILIDAIKRAMDKNHGTIPNRRQVLDEVAQTTAFDGLTGTYTFDQRGDALSPLMSVYDVEGGVWVYKGKIDASATA